MNEFMFKFQVQMIRKIKIVLITYLLQYDLHYSCYYLNILVTNLNLKDV